MSVGITSPLPERAPRGSRTVILLALVGLALLVALGLWWSKWNPYASKAQSLSSTHTWSGGSILAVSGAPGTSPSFSGAWSFAKAYFEDAWKGFLVFIVAAAGIEALELRRLLGRLMRQQTWWGRTTAAGIVGLPSMMCTCCSSPMVVSMRREGAARSSALAYWAANPVLNPAVLVFLFLVAPWQFGVVRIAVGIVLVVVGAAAAARAAGHRETPPEVGAEAWAHGGGTLAGSEEGIDVPGIPRRFVRALLRLGLVLVPEYFVAVLVIGWLSGWLSGFGGLDAHLGVLAVLVAVAIGVLLVIPTAGEIPVLLALTAGGLGASGLATATAGGLLIALPAISLPSMVMVGRSLSWRVTLAMAGVVAVCALVSAVLLWVLA